MTADLNQLQLYDDYGHKGDAVAYVALAERLLAAGDRHGAATAYDRAYGLSPEDEAIQAARLRVLDALSVTEHGIHFRYIPGGTFLMGSEDGDPDETPVHPVRLKHYWLAETPLSWAKFCVLMRWQMPPDGVPLYFRDSWDRATEDQQRSMFRVSNDNKIRCYYCRAEPSGEIGDFPQPLSEELIEAFQAMAFYDDKPMVAVSWEMAEQVCVEMSTKDVVYRLPTEAEWEKAARGGLIGATYAWGNDPPTTEQCDFDHFGRFEMASPYEFAPNGYKLYGMCGGVWEWTGDVYDGFYYAESVRDNPKGPEIGQERVLRGGSWADGAEAITVSFRMSRQYSSCPNIGFRVCRVERA